MDTLTTDRAPWQDRANPVRMALEQALDLAAQGIPVFPCLPSKRPACPHGFKQAAAESSAVEKLWKSSPGVLIGVPTGEPSGFYVLDVDTKHAEATVWLQQRGTALADTRRHQTQSGGWHFLFQHQPGLRNTASRLARGVDTRGDGGYVIWWPAHLGGAAQHRFALAAPLPAWLVEALNPPPPSIISYGSYTPMSGSPDMRLEGILVTVASAREGERNQLTFWGACKIADMVATRDLDAGEAVKAIEVLTEAARRTGLPLFEIRRTIASAMR